ncbi:MAG TPA: LamG domain-containing protein [Kofleriaceae bacterium]
MRIACLLWWIAGCGFSSAPGLPGTEVDAGAAGSGGPATGCDVSDPSLRLCLTFDQTPMKIVDLANPAHVPVDASGVTQILRLAGGAAKLDPASRIRFAEHPDYDVAELTIDMWIAPAALAPDKHYWMLDNNTQYYAVYDGDGSVRCGIGGATSVSSRAKLMPAIPATWHHVACTYGGDHELRVYVDGDLSGCAMDGSAIPTTGADGVAIGANFGAGGFKENFIGGLDGMHVYARALTGGEICHAANRSGCSSQCQSQAGSDHRSQ